MIEESEKLCEAFKPCGPMTVLLIRDEEGIDWFIERNPRYGGGAPLSMKSGARSAEMLLHLHDGDEVGEYEIADGAVYSRFDQSVCITEGKRTIKGVIFDLDDTLYSEKEYVRSGYRAVSDYLGGGHEERLWQFFEAGKAAIDELLKEQGREADKQMVLDTYRNHKPDIHFYHGVSEMLSQLRKDEYRIGVIIDGRPEGQKNKIEALGLKELVDDNIITDELGGVQFRKPCDVAFRIIATRWRMNSSDIVYVGDNADKDFRLLNSLE